MEIIYNPYYDSPRYNDSTLTKNKCTINRITVGNQGLLEQMELLLGLKGKFANENKRRRLYREAISKTFRLPSFYDQSFNASPTNTAAELLKWRDELVMGGISFDSASYPSRINDLAEIEKNFRTNKYWDYAGIADRWNTVIKEVGAYPMALGVTINVDFPQNLLTPSEQRRLNALKNGSGVEVKFIGQSSLTISDNTDLGQLKNALMHIQQNDQLQLDKAGLELKNDGSIKIIQGQDNIELSLFARQYLSMYEDWQKIAIQSPQHPNSLLWAIENSGLPTAAIIHPLQEEQFAQLAKLVQACIWKPLNISMLLDLLLFEELPINKSLSTKMASVICAAPGRLSDKWIEAKHNWEETRNQKQVNGKDTQKAIEKFEFWIEAQLFDETNEPDQQALIGRIIELYKRLGNWSAKKAHATGDDTLKYLQLNTICNDVITSIQNLPATTIINKLLLEEIVNETIPQQEKNIKVAEAGCIQHVSTGYNLIDTPNLLVIWNCVNDKNNPLPPWIPEEMDWFAANGLSMNDALIEQKRLFNAYITAILKANNELMIFVPDSHEGESIEAGTVYSILEGMSKNLHQVTYRLPLQSKEQGVDLKPKQCIELPSIKESWTIENKHLVTLRESESYSSLENLFYYPYAWVLQYIARINPITTLSMANDGAMKGNLAHRIIEEFFANYPYSLSLIIPDSWNTQFNAIFNDLVEKEGASLLAPERKSELGYLRNQLQKAIPIFINECKAKHWEAIDIEKELEGKLGQLTIKSRPDILLQKETEKAVIDFKYYAAKRYSTLLTSGTDIQLSLYAGLWASPEKLAHSAYFIVDNATFLAKNNQAIATAKIVTPDKIGVRQSSIWNEMENTAEFRLAQICNDGILEVAEGLPIADIQYPADGEHPVLPLPADGKNKAEKKYNDYQNLLTVN